MNYCKSDLGLYKHHLLLILYSGPEAEFIIISFYKETTWAFVVWLLLVMLLDWFLSMVNGEAFLSSSLILDVCLWLFRQGCESCTTFEIWVVATTLSNFLEST